MSPLSHPRTLLGKGLTETLGKFSSEAEQKQSLHPEQLDTIFREKWFKLFVPTSLGGLGMSLPDALKLEEAIAYADGSTAWVVTLCGGAGWFVGFVTPEIATSMFGPNNTCIAGSGALSGRAEKTDDGFILSGLWPFASGSLHATAFTVNAIVTYKGATNYKPNGSPETVTLILPRTDVSIKKTWHAMGMVATGSHSFSVAKAFVPSGQSFIIDPKHAVLPDPIFQYPFLQFAETTLGVNISGMALRFIDLVDTAAPTSQQRDKVTKHLEQAKEKMETARKMFFQSMIMSWEMVIQKKTASEALLQDVTRTSKVLVQVSRECVNSLYPLTGLQGAFMDHEVNRVWRNIHTAAQHALLNNL